VDTLERYVDFMWRSFFCCCCICFVYNPSAFSGRIKSFVELAMFTSQGQEKVLKPFSLHICGSLLFTVLLDLKNLRVYPCMCLL